MYNPDTDLIFPTRIISQLASIRNAEWSALVKSVEAEPENETKLNAFVLMMVRLSGCVTCNSDSFRAMRGCTQCSKQAIKRYRGNDDELIRLYEQAEKDIVRYNSKKRA
jgi:hypothetical protein